MNPLRQFFGLERNIIVMLIAVIALGMGEELWSRFIPKYLEILGAGTWVIASYGTLRDFLDAVYQYPGGYLADRLGRRKALVIFTVIAIVGYFCYLLSSHWMGILIGTVFVMAWTSLSSPATFAIIGDSLPRQKRSMGFSVQAILKRVPIVLAPALGGVLIASYGYREGIAIGVIITILLGFGSVLVVMRYYDDSRLGEHQERKIREIWKEMHPGLKRLLLADCLIRWAEGIPNVFIVLYVINVVHAGAAEFGWLTGIKVLTSMLVYIPVAKFTESMNRKPFIILTFFFFSLFPLALVLAGGLGWMIVAFIIGGLRELGEPARKAMIVDLAHASVRGRSVGIYYLVRGLAVFPASILGGWLWSMDARLPFIVAFGVGIIGAITYALSRTETGSPPRIPS